MNRVLKPFLIFCLFTGILLPLSANYLRVQNISVDQATGTVSFDLAWDNSWRIDSTGAPNHWDAAWVFVKWRECNADPSISWTHGLLSTTLGDHSFANLEPTLSDGSAVGIDAAPNNTGTMLRRNANGLFPSAGFIPVSLRLSNFPATGDYDVKVFGIEMVYVPQGPFILGGYETAAFQVGGTPTLIDSEVGLTLDGGQTTTLPGAYPKGFDAFYCMKYEISQGQYAAFLNTLNASNQLLYFTNQYNSWRQRISGGGTPPNVYFSDRQDRAHNYMSWNDLLGYLDWAALRPMTELEYEKASRGGDPYVQNGYAWSSTNITAATTLQTPEDGTELVTNANANANYNYTNLVGGDGGRGPVRVGIFATSATTTRLQTGASFFGIMEMSGNVWEKCVAVRNDATILLYDGQWGDGVLNPTTGYADTPNWPYSDCSGGGFCYFARRGGSFVEGDTRLRTSDRTYYATSSAVRTYDWGGRGVR